MAASIPSTYTTERVTFVGTPEQRAGLYSGRDQKFINFFPEAIKSPISGTTHYFLRQRAGLDRLQEGVAGVGRGIYYYNSSVFTVIGTGLYRNGVLIQTLSTSTGPVGFQEYAGAAKYLIVLDGISGWTISATNVVVQITDVDFPTPHVVQAAYLDGYLFIAKVNTDDIYNCVLDDPFTWNAGDFITAEMSSDTIKALCRQNNYVVAIGQQTMEYFYDTGVFPGTPLARNNAALHQIGTPAAATVCPIEEQIIFVGQTASGGRTLWVMNGFTPNEIGIEPVKINLDAELEAISNATAFCIRSKGHRFYVLVLSTTTWAYDFEEKMWHQWASYDGITNFNCPFACDWINGSPLMLDRSSGLTYVLDGARSTDYVAGVNTSITSIATSSKLDFGSMNNKFMHRFSLLCDVPAPNGATNFTISWSDDDYQTWSTNRTITINDTMPTITQLGKFRRRAFKLTYAQVFPIRLEGFEVDLNLGSK